MEPVIADEADQTESDRGGERTDGTDKTDGEDSSVPTPAQSRSPSVHPQVEDGPDLFDGYSFKGRHSVLIDDEDEEVDAEGEEDEEGVGIVIGVGVVEGVIEDELDEDELDVRRLVETKAEVGPPGPGEPAQEGGEEVQGRMTPDEEVSEPKTPEARKAELPGLPELTPAEEIIALHKAATAAMEAADAATTPVRGSENPPTPPEKTGVAEAATKPDLPAKDAAVVMFAEDVAKQSSIAARQTLAARQARGRRERSGIPALDKYLSDGPDEEDDDATERDEDDDWDFVEAPGIGVEDRNGAKGTSLFARGVVDRYRLAVFRKVSTPSKNSSARRNVSGMSLAPSDVTPAIDASPSPSPSVKQRRGRNPALAFRRNPKQFLRARSPPSTISTSGSGKTLVQSSSQSQSNSNTLSSAVSSGGLITPSTSAHPSTLAGPSLKSKESTTSMGSPSSDDQSVNGEGGPMTSTSGELALLGLGLQVPVSSTDSSAVQTPLTPVGKRVTIDEPEKPKTKKLKKYKEGAEKVLSFLASPRQ